MSRYYSVLVITVVVINGLHFIMREGKNDKRSGKSFKHMWQCDHVLTEVDI